MSLIALQRAMRDHLVQGRRTIAPHVRGNADSRLGVYHHAYRMQLLAALRDTYEKTWSWLGDERFDAAGLQYIEEHPPHSWTLSDYGTDFITTLATCYPNDAEVGELAWLDFNLRRAFDDVDVEAISPAALANVDWDRAALQLTPTLRMTSIETNCAALWTAIADGKTPPAAAPLSAQAALRVWRQGLTPRFRSITCEERQALERIGNGADFGTLCASLADTAEDSAVSERIGGMLASWLQDGLVVAVV